MTVKQNENENENENKNSLEGKETRNCIILAVGFLATFTAYHAMQNLQSSLNEAQGLGTISLSVLYGCLIVSGIMAPTAIRYLGTKGSILLSWVIHLLYIGSNLFPSFYTLIPSSALLGSISGFLWTSQSTYIATCSYSLAKTSSQSTFVSLNKLNGIFFTVFETTQIPGNLVSSLVLYRGTNTNMTATNCGSEYCPKMSNGSDITKPEANVVYTLLGVFLGCDVVALIITVLLLTPIPNSQWIKRIELKGALLSFFKTLFTSKLLFLVPIMMYQAVEHAILWGDYTRSYISCTIGIQMVGFVMATYGVVTAVSAFLFSRLAAYLPRFVLICIASGLQAGVFVVMYIWTPTSDDIIYIFLLPMALGAGEGIWQTQFNSLIAVLFPDEKEPAFANLHTWKAVGFTITFAIGNSLCVKTKLLSVLILLLIGMILYAGVEIYSKMKEKRTVDVS